MTAVSIAQAKANLSSFVNMANFGHEEVVLQKHGKPVAVVIGYDDFQKLKNKAPKSEGKLTYKKLNPLEHIVKTDYLKYLDEGDVVDDDDLKISIFDNEKDALTLAKELRQRAWR